MSEEIRKMGISIEEIITSMIGTSEKEVFEMIEISNY